MFVVTRWGKSQGKPGSYTPMVNQGGSGDVPASLPPPPVETVSNNYFGLAGPPGPSTGAIGDDKSPYRP